MSTVYDIGVWRVAVTATKPNGGTQVSPIVMIPDGVTDLTVYVKGSAATTGKVEESPSSGVSIQTNTPAADWMSVDASLDSVGTTLTRKALDHTPVALRLTSLTTDQTATMVVTGKRIR